MPAGRFLEDFKVGDVYRSPAGRTISQADNTHFSLLTNNANPIHTDAHYAAQTEFGRPLVNSFLTMAVVAGLMVPDTSQNGLALGDEYWREIDRKGEYPERFVRALSEAGWLAALIPSAYGGGGLGVSEAAVVIEEINRSGANAAAAHAQMYTMGTLLRHGSEEQKR